MLTDKPILSASTFPVTMPHDRPSLLLLSAATAFGGMIGFCAKLVGMAAYALAFVKRRGEAIDVWVGVPDNGAAERAIRQLAIGRANWLHVGGDGGLKLKSAAVLLSVCASATRHHLNPCSYFREVLDLLAVRSAGADLSDLLPDAPSQARNQLAA